MKIAILTFHFSHNVGSALQAYALQKYLHSKSDVEECCIIDYEKKDWLPPPRLNNYRLNIYGFLRGMVMFWLVKLRIEWFKRFQRKYCNLSSSVSKEELCKLNDEYDMFVFGGDQIWCVLNPKVDDSYFGVFVNDRNKKISYAPSFGITELPEEKKDRIASLLREFKALSVREQTGQQIVNVLLGFMPQIVLDPVFLVSREAFGELENSVVKESGYCLCYIRDRNYGYALDYAKEIVTNEGLALQTIVGTELNGRHFPIIGPES